MIIDIHTYTVRLIGEGGPGIIPTGGLCHPLATSGQSHFTLARFSLSGRPGP